MVERLRKFVRNPKLHQRLSTLQAMTGRMRYPILSLLSHSDDGLTVKDLSSILSASPSRISHQLAILRRHGLIVPSKNGRMTSYSLTLQPSLRALLSEEVV